MSGVVAYLPCRAGSVRVPRKNTRSFAGREDGLLGIKLDHLEATRRVDAVVLDSNDPEVLDRGHRRRARWRAGGPELRVVERPDHLGQSSTTTDALIRYALSTVECETLLWTHVTSPLFGPASYEAALRAFASRDTTRHDSLMGVTVLNTFLWNDQGPLSYRREPLRWPRTQDIAPVYEVNSSVFIVPRSVGLEVNDRVGQTPLMFEVPRRVAQEIDDVEDFHLAEQLFLAAGREEQK